MREARRELLSTRVKTRLKWLYTFVDVANELRIYILYVYDATTQVESQEREREETEDLSRRQFA